MMKSTIELDDTFIMEADYVYIVDENMNSLGIAKKDVNNTLSVSFFKEYMLVSKMMDKLNFSLMSAETKSIKNSDLIKPIINKILVYPS